MWISKPAYLPPLNFFFQIFQCSVWRYFAAPAAPYFALGGQRKPSGFRIFNPAYLPPLNFSFQIFQYSVWRYFAAPAAPYFAPGGKVCKTPLRNQGFLEFPLQIPSCPFLLFGAAEIWTVSPSCAAAAEFPKFSVSALIAQRAPRRWMLVARLPPAANAMPHRHSSSAPGASKFKQRRCKQ